jgi:hypothetical protein
MKFLGVIALVAVIGFTMEACPNDDDGNSPKTVKYESTDAAGNTYTLTVTEKADGRAAYSAKTGDSYELKIAPASGAAKTSKGTVQSTDDGNLTLKPSNAEETFTVTITGGQMTAITGTIAIEGEGEPVHSPGTLTPVETGGNNTGGGDGSFNGKIGPADVYTVDWDEENQQAVYTKVTDGTYNGNYAFGYDYDTGSNVPLSTFLNGTPTMMVANNRLTVNLGTPKTESLRPITESLRSPITGTGNIPENQSGITISNRNAKMFDIEGFGTQDGSTFLLYHIGTNDDFRYRLIYADSAVKVTGSFTETITRSKWEGDKESGEEIEYEVSYKTIFALDMKQGWNYMLWSWSQGSDEDSYAFRYETVKPGSGAKWVISEQDPGGYEDDK